MNNKFKNPYFWLSITGLIMYGFSAGGINFESLTSWPLLIDAVKTIFNNPVAIMSVIIAFLGIWNDNSKRGLDKITHK